MFNAESENWFLFPKKRRIKSGISWGYGKHQVPHVKLHGVEHKSCSACCRLKTLDLFGVDRSSPDGLRSSCKACARH